jgi:hypothetical protein
LGYKDIYVPKAAYIAAKHKIRVGRPSQRGYSVAFHLEALFRSGRLYGGGSRKKGVSAGSDKLYGEYLCQGVCVMRTYSGMVGERNDGQIFTSCSPPPQGCVNHGS